MHTSYEVAKNLYLVHQTLRSAAKTVSQTTVHHILVVDCSGSMTYDLPQVRKHLALKLPSLINDGDTVSAIWFSGKKEFGVLLEGETVSTLKDLKKLTNTLDKWLRPVGMTGFKEPLQEASALAKRLQKSSDLPVSLFFMSDGGENQWPVQDVMKVVEALGTQLTASTFVEYGYYADRQMLASMAAKAGGTHIHADSFQKFEPVLDTTLKKRMFGAKRIEAKIEGDPIGGFVFEMKDKDLVTYEVNAGKVLASDSSDTLCYLSPSPVGGIDDLRDHGRRLNDDEVWSSVYAAMSLFAVRMKPDIVFPILSSIGDVRFIKQFTNCFGKQAYSEFMDDAKDAAFRKSMRDLEGNDPHLVPKENAFTLFDLLNHLSQDENATVCLDHSEFKYSRISRARVDAADYLSADEQEKLLDVQLRMQNETNAKKLKDMQKEIDEILNSKTGSLKFDADEEPDGYSISSLTYKEDRPNISILVRKTGTVDLTERLRNVNPTIKGGKGRTGEPIPKIFPTYIWRNYAIVRDGLVNVEKLPVKIDYKLCSRLAKEGVEMEDHEDGVTVLDLRPLPIINRQMVKTVSAEESIRLEFKLLQAQAEQKVYKALRTEMFPGAKLKGWTDLYGKEATEWLKEQGLTEYNGFNPKMVQAASTDVVVGKELNIKIKGYSTMPSMKDLREQIQKGKLNGPGKLMATPLQEAEAWLKKNPRKLHEQWLTGQEKLAIATCRGLMHEKSQHLFSIIVGQTWFKEFKTLDENTMTVKVQTEDGPLDITGICELKEVEIKI